MQTRTLGQLEVSALGCGCTASSTDDTGYVQWPCEQSHDGFGAATIEAGALRTTWYPTCPDASQIRPL